MNGAIVDSFITSFRRTGARKRGANESSMRYVQTKAGQLRLTLGDLALSHLLLSIIFSITCIECYDIRSIPFSNTT
jgi:hypothetical protein